jgi:uncharacterized protein
VRNLETMISLSFHPSKGVLAMKLFKRATLACLVGATALASVPAAEKPIKVMVIGGQNNHDWKKSTPFLKQILDQAGHFEAVIDNAPGGNADRETREAWRPKFKEFGCVVLDYKGQMWPDQVKKDFVEYIAGGGGAVLIHAAK